MKYVTGNNYRRTIEYSMMLILTLVICCPIVFIISKDYGEYIWFLNNGTENKTFLENRTFEHIFKIIKYLCPLLLAWLIIVWYDVFNAKKRKVTILINVVSENIFHVLSENKLFFYSLKKETRYIIAIFFTILFIAILYFILVIPLQYDEWLSYDFFTHSGFWTTLSNYTTTNNHVFYNLLASCFIKLPFDAEVTMRLPNLIITLLCFWYFFKLCKLYFSDMICIILMVFVICPHALVVYAFEARGYMCLNLFCVLMMYSSYYLSSDYKNKKYRVLFILSLVFGALSIPTFIYVILPIGIVLSIYVFRQSPKNMILFTKDIFISTGLLFLCYSFVFMFNDFTSIMDLNSFSTKLNLSEVGTFEKIINHLKILCTYLFFYESFLPFICILVLASTIFYSIKIKRKPLFLCVLSAVIFFSPLPILIIQRVIPFERNWLFLIFPSAICLGFVIDNIVNIKIFKAQVNSIAKYKLYFNAFLLGLTIFYFSGFTINHRNFATLDFKMDDLRKEHLNPVINNIKEIGLTKKGYEFYTADVILFICHKEYPKRKVSIGELLNVSKQDILIIDKAEMIKFKDQLGNYKLLKYMNDQIAVYGKVGLF